MTGLRLMLVRHGQTESNVQAALDSALPGPPLTELGVQQAAALADRLASQPVTGVYASAAVRARQTAQPVADVHRTEVTVLDGVHEVQAGDLEMRTDAASVGEYMQVVHRWMTGELDARMPGTENGHEIRARFTTALREVQDAHQDGLVVLVSHGGLIRLAAQWLVPEATDGLAEVGLLRNTGHLLLEADGDGWRCLEWTGLAL